MPLRLARQTPLALALGGLLLTPVGPTATPPSRAEDGWPRESGPGAEDLDRRLEEGARRPGKTPVYRFRNAPAAGGPWLPRGADGAGTSRSDGGLRPGPPPREPPDPAGREALYLPWIGQAAEEYDLPAAFIRAVIRVESHFKARAESERGAMGLMQLMPSVARELGVDDPCDPRANIRGGAALLRRLADRFDGDIVKVLSAYHAGSGAVKAAGGVPWEATEGYVRSVLDHYYRYVDAELGGPDGTGAAPPDSDPTGESGDDAVDEPPRPEKDAQ